MCVCVCRCIAVSAEQRLTCSWQGDFYYVLSDGTCDIFKDGTLVLQCNKGMGFGELALMYDAPRAATVKATSPAKTWAIDRMSFKQVMMGTTTKKRTTYEGFLEGVPILATLSKEERLTVADALQTVSAGVWPWRAASPPGALTLVLTRSSTLRRERRSWRRAPPTLIGSTSWRRVNWLAPRRAWRVRCAPGCPVAPTLASSPSSWTSPAPPPSRPSPRPSAPPWTVLLSFVCLGP